MADTFRWVQPGWDGLPHMNIQSKRHQARDHPTLFPKQGGKFGRFVKGCRNSRYNLIRKIEQLDTRDACST